MPTKFWFSLHTAKSSSYATHSCSPTPSHHTSARSPGHQVYQPMAQPSARPSEPAHMTPVSGLYRMICPRPNTARLYSEHGTISWPMARSCSMTSSGTPGCVCARGWVTGLRRLAQAHAVPRTFFDADRAAGGTVRDAEAGCVEGILWVEVVVYHTADHLHVALGLHEPSLTSQAQHQRSQATRTKGCDVLGGEHRTITEKEAYSCPSLRAMPGMMVSAMHHKRDRTATDRATGTGTQP